MKKSLLLFLSLLSTTSLLPAMENEIEIWENKLQALPKLNKPFKFKTLPMGYVGTYDERSNLSSLQGVDYPKIPMIHTDNPNGPSSSFGAAFLGNEVAMPLSLKQYLPQKDQFFFLNIQQHDKNEEPLSLKPQYALFPGAPASSQDTQKATVGWTIIPGVEGKIIPEQGETKETLWKETVSIHPVGENNDKLILSSNSMRLQGIDTQKSMDCYSFIDGDKASLVTYHWMLTPHDFKKFNRVLRGSDTLNELIYNLDKQQFQPNLLKELKSYVLYYPQNVQQKLNKPFLLTEALPKYEEEIQKNIGLEGLSFNDWKEIREKLKKQNLNIQDLDNRLDVIAKNQDVFFSENIWKSSLNMKNHMQIIHILLEGDEKQITALADALKEIIPTFSKIFESLNLEEMTFNNTTISDFVLQECEFLKLCLFTLSANQLEELKKYILNKLNNLNVLKKKNWSQLLSEDQLSINFQNIGFTDKWNLSQIINFFRKQLIKSAENNNVKAMSLLGLWYLYGDMDYKKDYKKAKEWLMKAADKGSAESLNALGEIYRDGKGVKPNPESAIEFFKQAVEKGSTEALSTLGIMYRDGDGVEKNPQKAVEFFMKSAEQGNTQAISFLAKMYKEGDGVEKDPKKAIELFTKIAKNNVDILMYLGEAHWFGDGIDIDYKEAKIFFEKAARQGNRKAMSFLGEMYRDGKGVEIDLKKAIEYCTKSAEKGYVLPMRMLGNIYINDKYGQKDLQKARSWYKLAAKKGSIVANVELGKIYRDGTGVKPDLKKSIDYFKKAAKEGNAEAMNALGEIYRDGTGVKPDLKKSIDYFKKAAKEGNAEAMNALGEIYRDGKGVKPDLKNAEDWLIQAIKHGSTTAEKSLIEIGSAETMNTLAAFFKYGNKSVKKDDEQVVRWYARAAEKGSVEAMNALIEIYKYGRGSIEQDYEQVVYWYMKAAEKGDDKAMFNLGKLYQDGKGVQKDLKKAIECFMKAAEKGNGEAWGNLGSGYYYGHGVENDLKKAAECYENALKKGYTFYTFRLGEMYRDGEGVQKNFEKAIDYFTKAVSNDFAHAGEAGNVLGEMYRDGKGVEKNPKIAEEWFRKAKKKGNSSAIKNLDEMFFKDKNIDEKNEINVNIENNYIHEKIKINLIIEKQKVEKEDKEKTYMNVLQGNDVEKIDFLAEKYFKEGDFKKAAELYKRSKEILLSFQTK